MSGTGTLRVNERRPSFLARQFAVEPTKAQNNFDFAFGVFLPIVCFLFDPIVFNSADFPGGPPVWGEYKFFAYCMSAVQIVSLLALLLFRRHLQTFAAPISGVLILGGLFSFLVGVLILPLSVLGLIFLIGIAGFTPFVTSFVYLRNGVRCLRSQDQDSTHASRFQIAAASAVIAVTLPVFATMQLSQRISTSLNTLLKGDDAQAEMAVNRLKRLPFVSASELRPLVNAYVSESNTAKKAVFQRAYKDLTGEDIERHLIIMD